MNSFSIILRKCLIIIFIFYGKFVFASNLEQLTFSLSGEYQPDYNPKNNCLVYVSDERSFLSLYTWKLDENSPKLIHSQKSEDMEPRFDSSGKWIYFSSRKNNAEGDVMRIHYNGRSNMSLISSKETERHPVPSSDGNFLVFEKKYRQKSSIWLFPLKGRNRLARSYQIAGNGAHSPDISNDGKNIVFSRKTTEGSKLFLYNIDTKHLKQLTFGETLDFSPSFSPDSNSIVFSRIYFDSNKDGKIDKNDHTTLFTLSLKTEQIWQLTDGGSNDYSPVWREKWIYFSSDRSGNFDIWRISPKGLISQATNEEQQWKVTQNITNPLLKVLAYERFLYYFPESHRTNEVFFMLAKTLATAGQQKHAAKIYKNLSQKSNKYQLQSEIANYKLQYNSGIPLDKILRKFANLVKDYPVSAPSILMETAILEEKAGNIQKAQEFYKKTWQNQNCSISLQAIAKWKHSVLMLSHYGYSKKLYMNFQSLWSNSIYPIKTRYKIARSYVNKVFIDQKDETLQQKTKAIENFVSDHPIPDIGGIIAMRILAKQYEDVQRYSDAISIYCDLLKIPSLPMNDTVLISLVKNYDKLGKIDKIISIYSSFNSKKITSNTRETISKILFNQAEHLELNGKLEEALSIATILHNKEPDFYEALKLFVRLKAKLGKISEVILNYKKIMLKQNGNLTSNQQYEYALSLTYNLSKKKLLKKKLKPAIAQLQNVIKENPYFAYAYQTLGWCFEQIGRQYQRQGKDASDWFAKAIQNYRKSMLVSSNDTSAKQRGILSLNLGNVFYRLKKFKRAAEYFNRWLVLWGKAETPFKLAITHFRLGRSLYYSGNSKASAENFAIAAKFFKEKERKNWLFITQMELGLVFYDQAKYAAANAAFISALKVYPGKISEEKRSIIKRNIAINYYYLGDFTKSLKNFNEVLKRLDQRRYKSLKKDEIKAFEGFNFKEEMKLAYTFIAEIYRAQGRISEAIKNQRNKLKLYPRKGNIDWKARILNTLGDLYFLNGDFQKAVDAFYRSAELCKDIEQYAGLKRNYLNLANIALIAEDAHGANLKPFGRLTELKIAQLLEQSEQLSESDKERISFLLLRAKLYYEIIIKDNGLVENRLSTFSLKPLTLKNKKLKSGNSQFSSSFPILIQKSLSCLRQAVYLANTSNNPEASVEANIQLSMFFNYLNDKNLALGYANKALALAENNHLFYHQYKTLALLASLHSNNVDLAQQLYKQSINIYEALLSGEIYSKVSFGVFPYRLGIYDKYISILLKIGKTKEAFFYNERKKGAAAVLLFSKHRDLRMNGERGKLLKDYKKAQDGIKRVWIKAKSQGNWKDYSYQKKKYGEALRNTIDLIEIKAPNLINYLTVKAWHSTEVETLLDEHEAILEFFTAQNPGAIWLITSKQTYHFTINMPVSQLHSTVFNLFRDIKKRKSIDKVSSLLSEKLMGPIEDLMKNIKYLTIVPDEGLDSLPFCLLKQKDGKIALEHYIITYLPAASRLGTILEHQNFNHRKFLGYGNSKIDKSLAKELLKYGEYFPIFTNRVDKECSSLNFKDLASNDTFDIIHFSLPFDYNNIDPFFSSIKFNQNDDLTLKNLLAFSLKTNLLTFADINFKNYFAGNQYLSESLFFTNTASILLPQWHNNFKMRQIFFKTFYRSIDNKESKAESLVKAQLAVRKKLSNPLYWAGYKLNGHRGFNPAEKKQYLLRKAKFLYHKASQAERNKNFLNMIKYLEKLADVYNEFHNTEKTIYGIYSKIMIEAFKINKFQLSLSFSSKLMKLLNAWKPISQADRKKLLHLRRATIFSRLNEPEKSISEQKKYLKNETDAVKRARAYVNLSRYYQQMYDFDNAMTAIKHAKEELKKKDVRNNELLGEIFYYNGLLLNKFDEYKQAEELLLKAEDLLNKNTSVNAMRILVNTLHELVILEDRISEYTTAFKFAVHARKLSVELNDVKRQFISEILIAQTIWLKGDNLSAHSQLIKAEELLPNLKLKRDELFDYYNIKGLIYLNLGELSEAEAAFQKNLKQSLSNNNQSSLATTYNQLGLIELKKNNSVKAQYLFFEALKIDERTKSLRGIAQDNKNIAITFLENNKLKRAKLYFNKALETAQKINEQRLVTETYYLLGKLFLRGENYKEAFSLLKKADKLARRKELNNVSFKVNWLIALILNHYQRYDEAEDMFYNALGYLEKSYLFQRAEKQSGLISLNPISFFQDFVELLVKKEEYNAAFNMSEKARLFLLQKILKNQLLPSSFSIKPKIIAEEADLRQQISLQANQLQYNKKLKSKANNSEKLLRILYKRAALKIPEFIRVRKGKPLSIFEIQKSLKENQIILDFFIAHKNIFVWVIHSNVSFFKKLDITSTKLEKLILQYKKEISAKHLSENVRRTLYKSLILPLKPFIKLKSELIIIPFAEIAHLSFASFTDNSGFLIQNHSISYRTTASFIAPKYKNELRKPLSVLAIGNSRYQNDDLHKLSFLRDELKSIAKIIPNTYTLYKERAREDTVKKSINSFSLVHFAAHSNFRQRAPLLSSLLLNDLYGKEKEFPLYKLMQLPFEAQIVVLSGCNTALIPPKAEQPALGIAQGIRLTGVPAVVGTLWEVDDLITLRFMKVFYHALNKSTTSKQAFYIAQSEFMKNDAEASNWAAFVFWGF